MIEDYLNESEKILHSFNVGEQNKINYYISNKNLYIEDKIANSSIETVYKLSDIKQIKLTTETPQKRIGFLLAGILTFIASTILFGLMLIPPAVVVSIFTLLFVLLSFTRKPPITYLNINFSNEKLYINLYTLKKEEINLIMKLLNQ